MTSKEDLKKEVKDLILLGLKHSILLDDEKAKNCIQEVSSKILTKTTNKVLEERSKEILNKALNNCLENEIEKIVKKSINDSFEEIVKSKSKTHRIIEVISILFSILITLFLGIVLKREWEHVSDIGKIMLIILLCSFIILSALLAYLKFKR